MCFRDLIGGDISVSSPTMCQLSDYPFCARSPETELMVFDFSAPVSSQHASIRFTPTIPEVASTVRNSESAKGVTHTKGDTHLNHDTPAFLFRDTEALCDIHAFVVWIDVILDAEATLLGGPRRENAFVKQVHLILSMNMLTQSDNSDKEQDYMKKPRHAHIHTLPYHQIGVLDYLGEEG